MIFKYKEEYFNLLQVASVHKTFDGKVSLVMANGNSHAIGQPEAQDLIEMLEKFAQMDILGGDDPTGYTP